MSDFNTALDEIKAIRKECKLTNLFIMGKELGNFLQDSKVTYGYDNSLIVLKKQTEYCTKLFYVAKDIADLKRIPDYITESDKRPIMVDIVGRDGEAEKICEELSTCDFSHYITFGKWSGLSQDLIFKRKYTDEPIWDEPVRLATLEDLDRVYELLYDNFDKLSYELQDKETLKTQIENSEVYVTGIEGKVVAFFIALRPSKGICMLDYSAVDKEVRGVGACMYIYGYVLQRLPENVKIIYYANPLNSVTGRENGLFGMKKENFSKIIIKYNK